MSKVLNLEALRALYAFNSSEVGNKKQKDSKNKFNYSAAVQELPSMLRMNGLRATLAYYYSKEKHHGLVFKQIRDWFKTHDPSKTIQNKFSNQSPESEGLALAPEKAKEFITILLALSDDEYRLVQAETFTLANWMIRFAKDFKPQPEKQPKQDEQPEV